VDDRDADIEQDLDAVEIERLDAAWDAYLAGAEGWTRYVPPAQTETIRRLYAGHGLPGETARRVWVATNDLASPGRPLTAVARPSRAPGFLPIGAYWPVQALAAALLIATLAGVAAGLLGGSDVPGDILLGGTASAEAESTRIGLPVQDPGSSEPVETFVASPGVVPTAPLPAPTATAAYIITPHRTDQPT
jgi:hypothetical protein